MKPITTLALVVAALLSTGCASIITGTSTDVSVTSVPEGATFRVMPSGETGVTPAIIKLSSKRKHMVTYDKQCYTPAQTQLDKSMSGWTFLNLIIPLWPLWFGVDFATGGAYTLDDSASTVLIPDQGQCMRTADGSWQPKQQHPQQYWQNSPHGAPPQYTPPSNAPRSGPPASPSR